MSAGQRMSARDATWLSVDSAKVVGPLVGITADAVRTALIEVHGPRPGYHLLSLVDRRHRRWRPLDRTRFAAWVERLVVPVDTDDGDHLADRLLAEPLEERPVLFVVGPRYVGYKVSHAAADGRAADALLTAVLTAAAQRRPALHPTPRPVALPLLRAAAHQFLRRPARLRSAVQVSRPPRHRPAGTGGPWRPNVTHAADRSGPALLPELRRWRDAHRPRVSLAAVLFSAAYSAVARHLGPPDPSGMVVLVDARRYLPPDAGVDGNFAWGEYLCPAEPADPRHVQSALGDLLRSRRSLTMLALHNLKAFVRPGTAAAAGQPSRPRPHLTLTHLGHAEPYATLPWSGPEADRRLVSIVTPAGPESVTLAMEELSGSLHLTATYHDTVFDPDAVAAALNCLTKDPIELLDA